MKLVVVTTKFTGFLLIAVYFLGMLSFALINLEGFVGLPFGSVLFNKASVDAVLYFALPCVLLFLAITCLHLLHPGEVVTPWDRLKSANGKPKFLASPVGFLIILAWTSLVSAICLGYIMSYVSLYVGQHSPYEITGLVSQGYSSPRRRLTCREDKIRFLFATDEGRRFGYICLKNVKHPNIIVRPGKQFTLKGIQTKYGIFIREAIWEERRRR